MQTLSIRTERLSKPTSNWVPNFWARSLRALRAMFDTVTEAQELQDRMRKEHRFTSF